MLNRRLTFLSIYLLLGLIVAWKKNDSGYTVAATTPAVSAAPVPSFSAVEKIGMFAYPRNNQNRDQQLGDEYDCYIEVRQQTGKDPETRGPSASSAAQVQAAEQEAAANASQVEGGRVRGAARGAAGGAAIGAISGNAGRGAAIGGVVGTVRGGRRQREADPEAKEKAAQPAGAQTQNKYRQARAARNEQKNTFKRGFSACMDARGYSVR